MCTSSCHSHCLHCLQLGSPLAYAYTELVRQTTTVFHQVIPGSSVSVDVPWSPYDVDGRNYDWAGLSAAADLLFIMAYDTQSQVTGTCHVDNSLLLHRKLCLRV